MSDRLAQRFIDALHRLEENGDVEPLVDLFSVDCEVSNSTSPHVFRGKDGALSFWREYRATFKQLHSSFRSVIETGDRVALEWVTEASGFRGQPVKYSGVSLLQKDEEGRIQRFCAYFDAAQVGYQLAPFGRDEQPTY